MVSDELGDLLGICLGRRHRGDAAGAVVAGVFHGGGGDGACIRHGDSGGLLWKKWWWFVVVNRDVLRCDGFEKHDLQNCEPDCCRTPQ
jgi:hypothetical protein